MELQLMVGQDVLDVFVGQIGGLEGPTGNQATTILISNIAQLLRPRSRIGKERYEVKIVMKLKMRLNPTWYGVLNYLVVWGGAESARREEWPLRLTEGSAEATNHDKYCS